MTGKTFRRHVYATIAALLLASFATLWLGVICAKYADASRAAIAVYIAVAAAWLTFCLQRRVAYTNALRSLWEKIVDAIQNSIQYTHLDARDEKEFVALVRQLSCRVDEVRGVFRNVGEIYQQPTISAKAFVRAVKHARNSEHLDELVNEYSLDPVGRGVYPFESLKQIQGVIEKLGYGPTATVARGRTARRTILILWATLRGELLKELDRDYPEFPDTPYEQGKSSPVVQREVAKAGDSGSQ